MDQHPIPQDVTGFQFKLIGSMTVKQFGFVAVGVIMAVILYYLPLEGIFGVLTKIIFIPLFGASGVIVSFVPVEGRPIDIMATNFVKAIFSPNQYLYKKQGRPFAFLSINTTTKQPTKTTAKDTAKKQEERQQKQKVQSKDQQLQAYLLQAGQKTKNKADEKELAFLKTFSTIKPVPTVAPTPVAAPTSSTQNIPIKTLTKEASQPSVAQLAQQEVLLQQQLTSAKQEESTAKTPEIQNTTHQQVHLLEDQIKKAHEQKMKLEQELSQLKKQLEQQKKPPGAQPATNTIPAPLGQAAAQAPIQSTPIPTRQPSQFVKVVSPETKKKVELPSVSDTPNVVVGIVKDPRGNVLPNILVEVKDKEGNPVRAFKTNALGQFASATPLTSGVYTIELEDPKKLQLFDVLQVTATGQILMPIEIISHDAREQLRKELFN